MEAFGQVGIEAAACGTPSIAFKNTGVIDAIDHKNTGYLANYMDQKDFEEGIEWILKQLSIDKKFFYKKMLSLHLKIFLPESLLKNIFKFINQF